MHIIDYFVMDIIILVMARTFRTVSLIGMTNELGVAIVYLLNTLRDSFQFSL